MVMLSKMKRFSVIDAKNRRAALSDLAVALLEDEYPPVTQIFVKREEKLLRFDWAQVKTIDWKKGEIEIEDFDEGKEISRGDESNDVLLFHEVLDALLLDLLNRTSTRANDLELAPDENDDNSLRLRAADTSVAAILRRLSRGLYSRVSRSALYDWKYVEFLRGDPQCVKNGEGYHLRINRLQAGEIAQLAGYVPYLHAAELVTLLPDDKAVKVLELMPAERQLQVFEELGEEQAARLLAIMAPDAAADLAGRLSTATLKHYLTLLPRNRGERIIELLRYPEDTVGGIMTNDVAFVSCDASVAEARKIMREKFAGTDFVYFIYVVSDDDSRVLRGMIQLKDLMLAGDDEKLEAIMDPYIETLNPVSPARGAAFRVIDSELAAIPVVGDDKRLLGAVTIDAAIDQISTESSLQGVRIFS